MRIVPALVPKPDMQTQPRRWASGIAGLDAALGGGMAYGCVHELYAADPADAAATAAMALALSAGMAEASRPVLWLRSRQGANQSRVLQGNGWAELGGRAGEALVGIVPDTLSLLRAAVDAVRCAASGVVIIEGWGKMPELDLTASRRLALAAEKSGVPLFVLRIDALPNPSAAQTRWQVAAAPSLALPGNAPGLPTFDIELLRQRSGPSGMSWRLEWDRDRRIFREATLSGAVVSVPARRPSADAGAGTLHQGKRRAA